MKSQLRAYHDYGEYDHDLSVVTAQAQDYVLQRAKQVTKPLTVIFITGRDETLQQITQGNLEHAGYTAPIRVITRSKGSTTESAADYKAVERAKLEKEGYTIVANVGDQPSDLACSFADKSKPNCAHAERGFLLPNPFYRIP